jgi:hypothetical protein
VGIKPARAVSVPAIQGVGLALAAASAVSVPATKGVKEGEGSTMGDGMEGAQALNISMQTIKEKWINFMAFSCSQCK